VEGLENRKISLFSLVGIISNTIDLISPVLVNHHKQVAIIAYNLAKEKGLPWSKQKEIILAAILHDIGALTLEQRLTALDFEGKNLEDHMKTGYYLISEYTPFKSVAEIVRFHHVYWRGGKGREHNGQEVPMESHLLHLADRIAVLIKKDRGILNQVDDVYKKITERSGTMFMPELVEVFKSLAHKEYFWLEAISNTIPELFIEEKEADKISLDDANLLNLTKFYAKIIDFRSPFTANHSSGVAATAQELASLAGFSREECRLMGIAGYLHDLGKLAIPVEIINKPGKLTKEEFNWIRCHSYYTYEALKSFPELATVNEWASLHHEKLSGTGYPFHLNEEELSLGSRIMAVADVFTAITEDRPYRRGMDSKMAIDVLEQMARNNELDSQLVALVKDNFSELNNSRIAAQRIAKEDYGQFNYRLVAK